MPVHGGYLRTNYRRTGKALDPTAIGGGANLGCAAGGSHLEGKYWGGFIQNSVSALGTTFKVQPLTDMIFSYWGSTNAAGNKYDSGYKIMPIGIQVRYAAASAEIAATVVVHGAWFSLSDSTDSTINVGFCEQSISGLASSFSAAFILAGFICSAPS